MQRAARDSLELASLASSDHDERRESSESSPSGPPSSRKLSLDDDDPLVAASSARRTRLDRSFSVTSAFDFAPPLFPLSTAANGYTALGAPSTSALNPSSLAEVAGASLEKHKSLTYVNGMSLVIGLIIGSGIFSSPSQVNVNAGSPGASLIIWAIAGVLAWTGASSYAELGGAIPLNGGAQIYLAKIFGEAAGFLYSWFTVCVIKPGSAAIIAIIFGEYLVRAVIGAEARDAGTWVNKGVAIAGILAVTLLNCISTKLASRSADVFMLFKFAALLGVTILGVIVATTGLSYDGQPSLDWKTTNWFEGTSTDLSRLAVAVYAGLWSYDGWDNVNFVVGEFINPNRDLPRVIHTSIPFVIVAYLLANTAYFLVLPLTVTSTSTTIAVAFGSEVFGSVGALVLALVVCGSCFGALNASCFTTGRLFYAASKEGYLPGIVGTLGFGGRGTLRLGSHSASAGLQNRNWAVRLAASLVADDDSNALFVTPVAALTLNAVITVAYVLVGSFDALITFYGVAGYSFYFLTVLGLLVLRVREPHLERPYRCWITTPIIFCCVSLFLLSRSIFARPWSSLAVLGFMVLGLVVYFVRVRGASGTRESTQDQQWQFWKRWGRK